MLSRIKNLLNSCLIYPIKGSSFLERASSFIMMGVLVFIMLFVGAEVVGRYFVAPIPGHMDIVELLMPAFAFLGLAYAQSFRAHIRVELLVNMLKGRVYHFVESLWLALSICVFLLLAIYTFENALSAYQAGDISTTSRIPTWGFRLPVAIGCALMCFRLIIDLTQNLIQLANGIERKDLNRTRMGG